MAGKENSVWKRCLLKIQQAVPGARIFRNNVGQAWTGKGYMLQPGQTYTAKVPTRVIMDPRPVSFGLMKGSGDGIGWVPRKIEPGDVGETVAQFVSLETKSETGSASPEQQQWAENVRAAGGIAVITKDPARAAAQIRQREMKLTEDE